MTEAAQQFQKDKPLYEKWMAIAFTDDFQKVLAFSRASILEGGGINADTMHGVNLLATVMVGICETQEPEPPRVGPGITHDLTVTRSTKKKE